MKTRKFLSILLLVFLASPLFTTSPLIVSHREEGIDQSSPLQSTALAEAPTFDPPSILVYIEFTDVTPGEELTNTMAAIDNTYGTNYVYSNLTDYNDLDTELPGKDILLIPEQELTDVTSMKTVGMVWNSSLRSFVDNGGVVILLDFGNETGPGLGLHIYNESGLMQINGVLDSYPTGGLTTLRRAQANDAMCRRLADTWSALSNTITIDTSDGIRVVDDGLPNYDDICVRKPYGRGNVVFLGFDLSQSDSNYEEILGNAVRLSNHVVFDESHSQGHSINVETIDFADDLVSEGFGVSRMISFTPSYFNASDILVIGHVDGIGDYTAPQIADIDTYVTGGGALFLYGDGGGYIDEIRGIANNFGYDWQRDRLLDTDDAVDDPGDIKYDGANILHHPISVDVTEHETNYGTGLTTLPNNAERVIISDIDGTSSWDTSGWRAEGVPILAVSRHGNGRIGIASDSDWLDTTGDWDMDGIKGYHDSNNSILALNIMHWLAGGATANEAPVITDVSHSPLSPLNGETVTISATVTDDTGLSNITCHYRVNYGAWEYSLMTLVTGDEYSADIGGFNETNDIYYYVLTFDSSTDTLESVSSIFSFHVTNQFPTAPILNDPGTTNDNGTFTLTWTPGSDPDGYIDRYEIDMSNTSGFIVVLGQWNASSTDKLLSGLDNGTYYFRVRSVDDHEAMSLWSNTESIEVAIPITDFSGPAISNVIYSPISPVQDDSISISATVTDFTGIENVTCHYRVNSGTWQMVTMTFTGANSYSCDIGSYMVDDQIDFYIQAFDNSTIYNEAATGFVSFQIANQPPSEPTLNDPGTLFEVSHVLVSWTPGSDPESAMSHHQLQISNSSDFTVVLNDWNATSASFNITGLSSGVYYIRVRAVDDHDAVSAWSNTESFAVVLSTSPTTTTGTTSPTSTTTPTQPFDPDILSLVLLVFSAGFVIIILMVVANYLRQRSSKRYQSYL